MEKLNTEIRCPSGQLQGRIINLGRNQCISALNQILSLWFSRLFKTNNFTTSPMWYESQPDTEGHPQLIQILSLTDMNRG